MTDWSKPVPVSDIVLAFPAGVIGTLLPPVEDIPQEFFKENKWTRLADRLFAGLAEDDQTTIEPREGVDVWHASRQVSACLRSFDPKHEHKVAGVAYLLSLFFADVEFACGRAVTVRRAAPLRPCSRSTSRLTCGAST